MWTRMLVCGLALTFFTAQLPKAQAQGTDGQATRAWDGVKALPPGEKIAIGLKSGKNIEGEINSVSDLELTVTRKNSTVRINREDVRRVYHLTPDSGAKSALVGAGIGAAIGAGGTAVSARTDDTERVSAGAALLPLVGAGTGALIGLAFGRRQKRILVYDSQ